MSLRRLVLFLLILPVFLQSTGFPALAAADTGGNRVVVYYFHQTIRCSTCLEFETFSKKALDTYFANDLANGRVEWRVVNMDLPENRHYVDEFKLFTKALVIQKITADKPVAWTNLEDIWAFEGDEPGFMNLVKEAVVAYL